MEARERSTESSTNRYTSTSNSYSAGRLLTALSYTAFFWIALPFGIAYASARFDDRLFWGFPTGPVWVILGALILAPSSVLLVVSVFQFIDRSGELPISAFRPKKLVQTGIYSAWRHPIYLFYSLSLTGVALILRSWAMLIVVLPLFVACVAVYLMIEERGLKNRFGEEYIRYCRRTPLVFPRLPIILRLPLLLAYRVLFDFTIQGEEKLPAATPFFIVAAHRSYLDPFFLGMITSFPVRFVTTYEAFRNVFIRMAVERLLSVPRRRYMPDIQSVKKISAALRNGYVVAVFPEGERSWTGAPGKFKPEAVKLLRHFHDIPVVPVKVEGNYAVWPRWRKGIRRGKISVTVLDQVSLDGSCDNADDEKRLKRLIAPSINDRLKGRAADARGLETVIYRCPRCGAFDTLKAAARGTLMCGSCGLDLTLDEELTLSMHSSSGVVRCTISELYRRIRINASDVMSSRNGEKQFPLGIFSDDETPIAASSKCRYSAGDENRLFMIGDARIFLTDLHLVTLGPRGRRDTSLTDITSVTIEGNNKLQVYRMKTNTLEQFRFARESALKWQDLIAESVTVYHGGIVNLT